MLDYNHRPTIADKINEFIDAGLVSGREKQQKRSYLGASRLGVTCERALQFEYTDTPKDEEKDFTGRTLRIFAMGHVLEDMAAAWLRGAGFDLYTTRRNDPEAGQFGFSAARGRLQGHVDGIISGAPAELELRFPMLWECKSLKASSWKDTVKRGVAVSKPVYAAQIATYQAYMESQIPGLSANPALFTAINKDTAELHHELLPFDAPLAQRMSDRAVKVITASEAGELLPRVTNDPAWHECNFCAWQERCWKAGHAA